MSVDCRLINWRCDLAFMDPERSGIYVALDKWFQTIFMSHLRIEMLLTLQKTKRLFRTELGRITIFQI